MWRKDEYAERGEGKKGNANSNGFVQARSLVAP
jgi:hypothetical protein